jgi:hypothetical protein
MRKKRLLKKRCFFHFRIDQKNFGFYVANQIFRNNKPKNIECHLCSSHHAEGLVNPKVRALKKGY